MSGSDNPRREEDDDDDEATTTVLSSQHPPKKKRRIIRMNDDDDNSNNEEEGVVGAAAAAAAAAAGRKGGVDEEEVAAAAAVAAPAAVADASTSERGGGPPWARVREPPPQYDDGTAAAKDVFALEYFYHTELDARNHEEARRAKLGEASVRDALLDFYTSDDADADAKGSTSGQVVHPLKALAVAIGAKPASVRRYFHTADVGTRTYFAGIVLKAKYKGDFQERTVKVGAALEPLLAPLTTTPKRAAAEASTATETGTTAANEPQSPGGRVRTPSADAGGSSNAPTINMEFLKDLRLSDDEERFLIPTTVYVRDCMRAIFGLFQEDVASKQMARAKSTALIGSPGVGASILFFLAALHQARTRRVVYCRITNAENENVSLFVMMPVPHDPKSVRVWFSRNMDKEAINDLSGLRYNLESELDMRRKDY
jgi:hypothetical protein